MSQSYEEIVEGEAIMRVAPGPRHERICQFLHEAVGRELSGNGAAKLLAPRSVVQLTPGTLVRPDLALVAAATGKIWLAAEIINSDDHRNDTVTKKMVYEETRLARLWMVDPRYNNVEIYHGTPYGLALKTILARKDFVKEELLPGLLLSVGELFDV
jgi:Uma2 family endonuclease